MKEEDLRIGWEKGGEKPSLPYMIKVVFVCYVCKMSAKKNG